MHKSILFLVLITFSLCSFSQDFEQQKQLAEQFYQNGEFDKAIPIYHTILKKSNYDKYIYNSYIKSLIEIKDYHTAEKELKKLSKQFPLSPKYKIDLGNIYLLEENTKKANLIFDEVLRKLKNNEQEILEVANSFRKIAQYDNAIKAYLIGQRNLNNATLFLNELAFLHLNKKDINSYIDVKLDLLIYFPAELDRVRGDINNDLIEREHYILLKNKLFKFLQKKPNNFNFSELLIWTLIHLKEYDSALIQSKALDKRLDTGGKFTFELAELLNDKQNYSKAIEVYTYLVEFGMNYYRVPSKSALLSCKKAQIEISNPIIIDHVKDLIMDYENFLLENRNHDQTIDTHKELANLYCYYLNDFQKAKETLIEAMKNHRLGQIKMAEFKTELGDIHLFSGDIWEAMLLYGQVDKDFKDSPIGDNAKFKIAKLSYYTGDFDWAQTQLDVLKASTTKIIANDALQLSTFITDNYGLDSIHRPMYLYAQAELFEHQKNIDSCFLKMDSILISYPSHSLTDDILFKKSKLALKSRKLEESTEYLRKIIEFYPDDLLIDDAIYNLAIILENNGSVEEAKELFEQIILKHSDSIFVTEARKKFRKLRGDNIN